MQIYWIYVSIPWQFFKVFARFSNMVNSNTCNAKIYLSNSNFPSKCDFKFDEDENKHSLAPCEGIIK